MPSSLTLDNAGRVSIPKSIRKELQIEPGDALELECHADRITLRPVRAAMPIRMEDGVWVYRSGQRPDVSLRILIEDSRQDRHKSILAPER